jgi:hypothetical protein
LTLTLNLFLFPLFFNVNSILCYLFIIPNIVLLERFSCSFLFLCTMLILYLVLGWISCFGSHFHLNYINWDLRKTKIFKFIPESYAIQMEMLSKTTNSNHNLNYFFWIVYRFIQISSIKNYIQKIADTLQNFLLHFSFK